MKPEQITPEIASKQIQLVTLSVCNEINIWSQKVFRTRGGRIGSGMGTLLEALWGYYTNVALSNSKEASYCELIWLVNNEYNDFACIEKDIAWSSNDKSNELLRVEAKSMNIGAAESKGHFDQLASRLSELDLLLVLIWNWENVDDVRVYPKIIDHFIGSALPIARLRDRLHIARGGTFVRRDDCPDKCDPDSCTHHGEPLNSEGKRERKTGPESRKSAKTSHAANFGGLVRMMKLSQRSKLEEIYQQYAKGETEKRYIDFFQRNYGLSKPLIETPEQKQLFGDE